MDFTSQYSTFISTSRVFSLRRPILKGGGETAGIPLGKWSFLPPELQEISFLGVGWVGLQFAEFANVRNLQSATASLIKIQKSLLKEKKKKTELGKPTSAISEGFLRPRKGRERSLPDHPWFPSFLQEFYRNMQNGRYWPSGAANLRQNAVLLISCQIFISLAHNCGTQFGTWGGRKVGVKYEEAGTR